MIEYDVSGFKSLISKGKHLAYVLLCIESIVCLYPYLLLLRA